MGIEEYFIRRVCEKAHESVGGGNFGNGIFEYNSKGLNEEVKLWNDVLMRFSCKDSLLRILLEGCDRDSILGFLDKQGVTGYFDSDKGDVIEYIVAGQSAPVLLEAKVRGGVDLSREEDRERVFKRLYDGAIIPIFSAVLGMRKGKYIT